MKSQRTAIVTGANRGLGLETCRQLAQMGYKVILTSRIEAQGEHAAQSLSREGSPVIYHQLDVTREESIQGLYEFVTREVGAADVLVNNAGVFLEEG